MQPEMYVCCGEQPTYLFVYENDKVYGICKEHFNSLPHRCFVDYVIDLKTGEKLYPDKIFEEKEIGALS